MAELDLSGSHGFSPFFPRQTQAFWLEPWREVGDQDGLPSDWRAVSPPSALFPRHRAKGEVRAESGFSV